MMQRYLWQTIALFGTLLCNGADAQSAPDEQQNKPLWEAGMFAAGFSTPQYPGAEDNHNNFIAAPYLIYRGEVFRLGDGSAARAVAIDSQWLELDLSLDASFNSDSDTDSAREGMPDLDYVFEIGPQLKIKLSEFSGQWFEQGKVTLALQARSAFSTDFSSIQHRGYVFHPELEVHFRQLAQPKDQLRFSLSPLWTTEKLQDYFFEVAPQYALDTRPEFDAKGGYLGTQLGVSYSFSMAENVRMFFGASGYFHSGAKNQDSPLFQQSNTYSFGVGVLWRFYQSEEQAQYRSTSERF